MAKQNRIYMDTKENLTHHLYDENSDGIRHKRNSGHWAKLDQQYELMDIIRKRKREKRKNSKFNPGSSGIGKENE